MSKLPDESERSLSGDKQSLTTQPGAFAELAAITDPAHPWAAAIRFGQELAEQLLTDAPSGATRRRHFILSVQRADGPTNYTITRQGVFEGDESEEDAFLTIWRVCCEQISEKSGVVWTVNTTCVLFYRLTEA